MSVCVCDRVQENGMQYIQNYVFQRIWTNPNSSMFGFCSEFLLTKVKKSRWAVFEFK